MRGSSTAADLRRLRTSGGWALRAGVAALLAGLLCCRADADAPPAPQPAGGLEQAADAVTAAVASNDAAALKALSESPKHDAWLVAETLLRRGSFDVAEAFSRASPRIDLAAMPAYVAAKRAKPDPAAAVETARQVERARAAHEWDAVVRGSESHASLPDGVGRFSVLYARSAALRNLGRPEDAIAPGLEAAQGAEHVGWLRAAWKGWSLMARVLIEQAQVPAAASAAASALRIAEKRDSKPNTAEALILIAAVDLMRGEAATSLGHATRALALARESGARDLEASALLNLGNAHQVLGDRAKATAAQEEALAISRGTQDSMGIALALQNLGTLRSNDGDWRGALAAGEEALAIFEGLGAVGNAAVIRSNLGSDQVNVGNFARAIEMFERAYHVAVDLGRRGDAATALSNRGSAWGRLGRFAQANDDLTKALEIRESLGDSKGVARSLKSLGDHYRATGDTDRAIDHLRRALAIAEKVDERLATTVMGTLATAYDAAGRRDEALELLARVLARMRSAGNRQDIGVALLNQGTLLDGLGRYDEARASFEQALPLLREVGDRAHATAAECNLGIVAGHAGRHKEAVERLERAVRELESLRLDDSTAWALARLAGEQAEIGADALVIETARRAVRTLEDVVGGLGETQGALVRDRFAHMFDIGAGAALRLDRIADLVFFLEGARAGTLLETMGGREAQHWVHLPADLAAALTEAQAQGLVAHRAYERALAGGDLPAVRVASEGLDGARRHEADVVERIQRDAKRQAGLLYPRPPTIEGLRDTLAPGEAMVLYGRTQSELVAVVIEPRGARWVRLGARGTVLGLAGAVPWTDPTAPYDASLDALRAKLWTSLALGPEATRILVSPDPLLFRVPFGALAPDRQVVLLPSGKTFDRLQDQRVRRGTGVLAIADPDTGAAGATALPPLPSARAEASAIADTVLSGADATEAAFRRAVAARPRWRAVHFACHGVFDEHKAFLTSLALTPTAEDDGRLSISDLWGMSIPTDLAVLSACETGRGRAFRGEGLLGLASAFLYAGAPRVLCSLWKVDDDATAALMARFYALWNPRDGSKGLPTAEALRLAQEHVRTQKKWAHPYYWAAWVLWGLGD